jgi:hypothetical protein
MNLREAVANLIKVKGRHNTEIAYQKLVEAFDADKPREWVGLTPEEAREISLANRPYVVDMIAALEARLKEKNT